MPSASIAKRLADYWVLDALASDESIDFSVLTSEAPNPNVPPPLFAWTLSVSHLVCLLACLSAAVIDCLGTLEGAPETTGERVALRCLQQLSSKIPAGGDAAATAGVPRFDGALSCQDVLFRLTTEVQVCGLYAGVCTLAIHICLPILSDSAQVVLCACICFCSCFQAFHLGNSGSG